MSRNVSMTAELLGDNKSHDTFMETSGDIQSIDEQLDRLEGEIRVGLALDDDASARLKAADEALKEWDGSEATATIRLVDRVSVGVRLASGRLEAFDGSDATATIKLKDEASGGLRYAFSYLDSWGETNPTATIRVRDQATPDIKGAAAELGRFDGDDAMATLDAEDRASGEIKGASAELGRLDGRDATAGSRWGGYYVVAVRTGLRPGEALALRWGDVNLESDPGGVRVRRTLDTHSAAVFEPSIAHTEDTASRDLISSGVECLRARVGARPGRTARG